MTKASSLAALFGVWTAGVAAAAAAYTVHKPLVPPPEPRVSIAEIQAFREDPAFVEPSEEEDVMMMPADTIVATTRPVARLAPVRAALELKCAGWVALAQGPAGAQVRYCE